MNENINLHFILDIYKKLIGNLIYYIFKSSDIVAPMIGSYFSGRKALKTNRYFLNYSNSI